MKNTNTITVISSNVHQVIEKRENNEYVVEWGYGEPPSFDKASFIDDFIQAMEETADQLQEYFQPLGIDFTILNSESAGYMNDLPCIFYLVSEDAHFGDILVTETGFEWRKKGHAPIQFESACQIREFALFLQKYEYVIDIMRFEISVPLAVTEDDLVDLIKNNFVTLDHYNKESELFIVNLGSKILEN